MHYKIDDNCERFFLPKTFDFEMSLAVGDLFKGPFQFDQQCGYFIAIFQSLGRR